jgi:hypothetical protein
MVPKSGDRIGRTPIALQSDILRRLAAKWFCTEGRTVLIAAARRAPRPSTTRLAPNAFQPTEGGRRRSASWGRKEQRERDDYSELVALTPNALAVTPFLHITVARYGLLSHRTFVLRREAAETQDWQAPWMGLTA